MNLVLKRTEEIIREAEESAKQSGMVSADSIAFYSVGYLAAWVERLEDERTPTAKEAELPAFLRRQAI